MHYYFILGQLLTMFLLLDSNNKQNNLFFNLSFSGAIILLLISSSITMVIPFSLGKVIDLIYTTDPALMKDNLNKLSAILLTVFLLGGVCNFGRVYLMNICGMYFIYLLKIYWICI